MDIGETAILIALVVIAVGGLRSGALTQASLASLKDSVAALDASLSAHQPTPTASPSMATSPVIREAMAETKSSIDAIKDSILSLKLAQQTPAEPPAIPLSMATSPVIREAMADPVFRSEMRSAGRELLRKRLAERAKKA